MGPHSQRRSIQQSGYILCNRFKSLKLSNYHYYCLVDHYGHNTLPNYMVTTHWRIIVPDRCQLCWLYHWCNTHTSYMFPPMAGVHGLACRPCLGLSQLWKFANCWFVVAIKVEGLLGMSHLHLRHYYPIFFYQDLCRWLSANRSGAAIFSLQHLLKVPNTALTLTARGLALAGGTFFHSY